MQRIRSAILACLAVLPASAGAIDVSGQTTQTLQPGDVLSFLISDGSFSFYAGNMGIAAAPTDISVDFASLPGAAGQFSAVLESTGGGMQAQFSQPLYWQSGVFNGSGYQGPVSVLYGSIHLPESVSQQIFSNSVAVLQLSYTGPGQTLGLSPYTLQQDMTVSLSGGALQVGAQNQGVLFSGFTSSSGASKSADSGFVTPEPHSFAILLAGAALFCIVGRFLKRFSQRNIQ
jgi:hypothetical protein